MGLDDALTGKGPYNGQQIGLSLRFEPRGQWPMLKAEFGVSETGAAIMLALWSEAVTGGRWTSYSRTQAHYDLPFRDKNDLYSRRRVIAAVDMLEAAGLIDHDRRAPGQRGWQSAMRARPEMVSEMRRILQLSPRLVPARPQAGIVLRDELGMSIGFRETGHHRRMQSSLGQINEALRDLNVSGGAGACMVRIFNQSFDRGGRFYAVGGAWQNLKKEDRQRLRINGEETIEIDYKALHPSMLYADAGIARPSDSYAVGNWPRDLVKVAVLVMLNAKSLRGAIGAIAHNDEMAAVVEVGSDDAKDIALRIIVGIKKLHAPIASAFHSDAGAGLMLRDSNMADAVMTGMLKKGVAVLPVHDSFIVKASKAGDLEETMARVSHDAGLPGIELKRA